MSLHETAAEQLERILAAWPAHQATPTWREETVRALAGAAEIDADIKRAVTKTIQSSIGRYPPDIATLTQSVARQRAARIQRERETKREEEKRQKPQPLEPWRGWLAIAAHHAHLADIGIPNAPDETLKPFVELVTDIGYRNRNGCPGDIAHNPRVTATALAGAERIWRAQGMPTPNPAALTGGAA